VVLKDFGWEESTERSRGSSGVRVRVRVRLEGLVGMRVSDEDLVGNRANWARVGSRFREGNSFW